MQRFKIRWLPQANQDLTEIRAYFTEIEELERGQRIVGTIIDAVDKLEFMPEKCQVDDEKSDYRRLVVLKKFKVYFRIVEQVVEINYIRHVARENGDI